MSSSFSDIYSDQQFQFFVKFSTATDINTLYSLGKFTGRHIVSHIQDDLYVAIGGEDYAAKARKFPGVLWVQKREGFHKIGSSLQSLLQQSDHRINSVSSSGNRGTSSHNTSIATFVAECWFDGCAAAAALVQTICSRVYIHPSLLEVSPPVPITHAPPPPFGLILLQVRCRMHKLQAAVSVLSNHVGVDHILKKTKKRAHNYGGRAIVGGGPFNTDPTNSRVLSNISVSDSIIGIADSGIDLKNCFFYDAVSPSPSTGAHRIVTTYEVNACSFCGTCCDEDSPPNCKDSDNTCGNYIDESGHGTHVSGTIAGSGPSSVAYGDGIAKGAKLFFTDIENMLSNDKCYYEDYCESFNVPTDLNNLFQPAFNGGV